MAEDKSKDSKPTKPRTTTNTTSYEVRGTSHEPRTGNAPKPKEKN